MSKKNVNKEIIENIEFLTPSEEYNGPKIDYVADEAGLWPTKEQMNVLNKTSDRLFFRSPKQEAEWITQVRDFCRETGTFPPHILQFYKEHHAEKAPE